MKNDDGKYIINSFVEWSAKKRNEFVALSFGGLPVRGYSISAELVTRALNKFTQAENYLLHLSPFLIYLSYTHRRKEERKFWLENARCNVIPRDDKYLCTFKQIQLVGMPLESNFSCQIYTISTVCRGCRKQWIYRNVTICSKKRLSRKGTLDRATLSRQIVCYLGLCTREIQIRKNIQMHRRSARDVVTFKTNSRLAWNALHRYHIVPKTISHDATWIMTYR